MGLTNTREENAHYARIWRAKNREHSRDYISNYFKNRIATDPIFARKHGIVSALFAKWNRAKNGKILRDAKLKPVFDKWLKNFSTEQIKAMEIDHVIPISAFLDFNKKIDVIFINHEKNLRLITKLENRGKYNYITKESLEVARELQAHFPKALKGLVKFLKIRQKNEINNLKTIKIKVSRLNEIA